MADNGREVWESGGIARYWTDTNFLEAIPTTPTILKIFGLVRTRASILLFGFIYLGKEEKNALKTTVIK